MTPKDKAAREMALAELHEMASESARKIKDSLDIAILGGKVDPSELRASLHNLTRYVSTIARWTETASVTTE